MFDKLLLISCICIIVALILNFFFWNRFIALMIGLTIRVLYWNQEASSIWVEIGAIHFSLLTGRILLKDVRYHSSNQTLKVVKGEIQWRYWIRRPTTEEDIDTIRTEDQKRPQNTSSCRIQISLEGLEWFIYNRTAAYNSIISQMDDLNRPISRTSQKDRRETTSPFLRSSSQRRALRVPMTIQNGMTWLRLQLPHLDPKELLPLGLDVSKGAIILGNPSTPNLTVAEFRSAEGTFGIVPSRSKYDLYKQVLSLKFQSVSGRLVPNTDFVDTMGALGELLHNRVKQDPTLGRASSFLSYRSFTKLWRQMKLYTATTRYFTIRREQWAAQQSMPAPSHAAAKSKVPNEAATPIGSNFSTFEYAIERKIFEAPVLELSYYVDVVGDVSADLDSNESNSIDIGNRDTAPEWGFDLVFYGGFLKYGPWADRQRSELQRAFFPATYQKAEVLARLQPGDKRVWTAMHVFIELRDETTLHIPFREASKDWQWDGLADVPQRQRKREAASLNVMVGDRSSIKYIMPVVANPSGYESTLEVHLDTILVTSSLNDIRLVSAESCRVRCELPSPLKWNDERTWDIAVFLRQPVLYLLRDHLNMFTDLGKDWASGPPTDWYKFIPMIYTVKFEMHHYELNLYANDQNIIDKPLIKDENALIVTRGPYIKSEVKIPLNIFRAESTAVSFDVSATDLAINILLPRWNTHALHAPKDGHSLLKAGFYGIEGSYQYFSDVHEDNIDQLKLIMKLHNSVYKATGWSIRYFMVLRDNYIGSFTHFSTLFEYLDKRRRNLPVGDPIVMKYRQGKNNILHVDLAVDIRYSIVLQPAGLLAYELADKDELKHDLRTGPCLVLFVPGIQLQLRLHDFYMEMSLNIDTVRGRIEKNYPEKVLYTRMSPSAKEILLIDGVDIVANRLFGPQPRTATYICLWEIRVGHVKAAISASDGNFLAAAGNSFRLNFIDSANAPAKNYQLPLDPDVTFYKVSFAAVDITWRAGHAALTLSCPEGFNIDTNDLGTRFYRKVTSLRVPTLRIQILLNRSPERNPWLEAAEIITDMFLDLYSAPEGFQEMVQAQSKFVEDQDRETGRSQRMFASVRQRTVKQGHVNHLNGLHLPHSRLPSLSTVYKSNGQHKSRVSDRPTTWRSSKAVSVFESDGEEGVSEADRDARLAQTRVLTPIPLFGNEEDMSSGDESDDADLTDGDSSDSDWSDVAEPNDSLLNYYSHLTRHYLPSSQGAPHFWEGPAFILTRERSHFGLSKPHSRAVNQRQVVSLNYSRRQETISTTCRVHFKRSIQIKITPLILPSLAHFEKDIMSIEHSPELCVESLIMGCLSQSPSFKSSDTCTFLDIWLPSVAIHCLQHVPFGDNEHQPSTKNDGLPAKLEATAVIEIGLEGFRLAANLTKLHPLLSVSIQQFDLKLNMSLNKRTLLAVSPGSSIFDFSLSAAKAGFKHGHLDFSLGAVSTEVGHQGPELLTATLIAFAQNAVQLVDTLKRLKEHNATIIHNIVCNIIKISGKKAIIDPLSTIQPSYLIQSGIPHLLRTDTSFRFLFHLRNCLWNIEEQERQELNVALKKLEPIPLDSLAALLKLRLAALDQEVYSDTSLTPLVPIFPALLVQGTSGVQPSTAPADIDSITLHMSKLDVSVRGPSILTSNRLTVTDLAINTRIRTLEVVHFSTKDVAGLSQTSLRRNAPRVMKQMSATISLGDVTLTIYPHLMQFAQRVLRVRKQYKPVGVKRNKIEQPSLKSSQLASYVVIFSLRRLRVQAVAENIIFEIGTVGTRTTSSLLTAKLQKTLAMNHSLFFDEVYLQARAPGDSTKPTNQNILASLAFTGGQFSAATLEAQTSKTNMRLVFSLQSLHLNVPRSAIRLYYYIEEWRADFLPGIEATAQALLSELNGAPKRSLSPNSSHGIRKDLSLQIHGKIEQLKVSLQVMHGTWLSWEINNILGYNNSSSGSASVLTHDFGIKLGSLIMNIASTPQAQDILPSPRVRLVLPPLSISGNYNGNRVRTLVLMEFVELKVKPSHWDTLLAVQQKFGQDFNDLVALMQESRFKKATPFPSKSYSGNRNLFEGSLKIRGFRIGLEGLSSTIYLECLDINGDLSNETAGLTWEIALSDLALSLASQASGRYDQGFNRGHRSAFVIIDFKVNGAGPDDRRHLTKALQLSVTKIHAVMQPSSIGQVGDFIDHMQAEMLDRKERRSHELAAFKEKTQQILKTFDVNTGDTQDDEYSWMNKYLVNVSIYNVGVAFPLALDQDLELPRTGISAAPAVRAFLFSIKSIEFGTHRGETGQASMKSFSFQFVPRFRQSIPADFAADSHQTRNRLVYPEMEAQLRTVNSASSRLILISANVSGFILDLDSSIPDYVFSLVDVYRQGKYRVEKLASIIARTPSSATSTSSFTKWPSEKNYSALPTSNVFGNLTFLSGKVRVYSGSATSLFRSRSLSIGVHEMSDEQILDLGAEVFNLPVVSVWAEYRAVPAAQKLPSSRDQEPSILMFKSTVHSSQNTLRPTLLPFLTELVSHVETRLRKISSRTLVPPSVPTPLLPTGVTSKRDEGLEAVSSMQISFSLRIDRSRLELTCQPDVNVIAGLHWDSGGFIVNVAPGAKIVSFTGSVGGLTVGLKHGFLSEDCVKLDARNLSFSVSFTKLESMTGDASTSVSIVLDTEFLGGVRFSRLQDILCFKAVWLDRFPIINQPQNENSSPNKVDTPPSLTQQPSRGLSTVVLVRIRQIKLDIDLGQSISAISLDLRNTIMRTRLTDAFNEVSILVGEVEIIAKGNLSGRARVPDCVFQTVRRTENAASDSSGRNRMLELRLTSGTLVAELESDHQKLLYYRAEPLEVEIVDDWSMIFPDIENGDRPLQLSFTVASPDVIAVVTVGTVPKIQAYINKFNANLNVQRQGASRESATFRITRSPKPNNPLSAVAEAMLYSARTRFKGVETGMSYVIKQHMSLRLNMLRLVIFPRTMNDPELAQFIGRDVSAILDRFIASEKQCARKDLHLAFSSMTISKFTRANHLALAPSSPPHDEQDGREWLSSFMRDASEANIVGLPSMKMHMVSEEKEEEGGTDLVYDFHSEFVRREGNKAFEDIYITLNVSLYSWLTILRKNVQREMEQVRAAADWRAVVTAGTMTPAAQRKKAGDPASATETPKSATLQSPGPFSVPSPQPEHAELAASLKLQPVSPVPFPSSKEADDVPQAPKRQGITYRARNRHIERLTMRQLGEATPDVMHPFFMKKAGFNLEDSLPQYVNEYATTPLEEILDVLLKLYSRQLLGGSPQT